MYAIQHKPTSQYLAYDPDTQHQYSWTHELHLVKKFDAMDEAIDFWTFHFCTHFRNSARQLAHVIKESEIVNLTGKSKPDHVAAYDRAMKGI